MERVGLVATNSIGGGNNLPVMKNIVAHGRIFEARSDEPWTVEGAAVRVAIVCFDAANSSELIRLDGREVSKIEPDRTCGVAMTTARKMRENIGVSFIGTQKNGPFDIPGSVARLWLQAPLNPNGRPNSDVLRPWANGQDITRRSSDTWVIDFGGKASGGRGGVVRGTVPTCFGKGQTNSGRRSKGMASKQVVAPWGSAPSDVGCSRRAR
jgi:hypothetical protein